MVFSKDKMKEEEIEKIMGAGKIHQEVVAYAKEIIKPGMKLFELAEKIDDKILELGGKPAFPINLSINEVAAHATPAFNDEEIVRGLLKVDIGVHVDGYVADSAFSLNFDEGEEGEKNEKLIEAAEAGLKAALENVKEGISLGKLGEKIEDAIVSVGENSEMEILSIRNLTGHQIEQHDLHAGLNISNYATHQEVQLKEGLYAIEPFATNGLGRVKDGKLSGIYKIDKEGNVRDDFARDVLDFVIEEYDNLPFCSRWIYKKFGSRGLLALRQIEQAGILHQYPQLVEAGKGKVAQAEHTVLLHEGKKIITTKSN